MVDDLDSKVERSGFSSEFWSAGEMVRVEIFRLRGGDGWLLEVSNREGATTVFDEPFGTDQSAFQGFLRMIERDGIRSFLGKVRKLH